MVEAVGSPAVRLVFDAFHVQVMESDVINNLDRVWDAVGIVQIADNPGRVEPGTDEMNYANILPSTPLAFCVAQRLSASSMQLGHDSDLE